MAFWPSHPCDSIPRVSAKQCYGSHFHRGFLEDSLRTVCPTSPFGIPSSTSHSSGLCPPRTRTCPGCGHDSRPERTAVSRESSCYKEASDLPTLPERHRQVQHQDELPQRRSRVCPWRPALVVPLPDPASVSADAHPTHIAIIRTAEAKDELSCVHD